jgi:hypothetical protein
MRALIEEDFDVLRGMRGTAAMDLVHGWFEELS